MAALALALGDQGAVAGLLLEPAQSGQDLAAARLPDPLLLLLPPHGPAIRAVVVGEEGRRGHPENGSGRGPRRRAIRLHRWRGAAKGGTVARTGVERPERPARARFG